MFWENPQRTYVGDADTVSTVDGCEILRHQKDA